MYSEVEIAFKFYRGGLKNLERLSYSISVRKLLLDIDKHKRKIKLTDYLKLVFVYKVNNFSIIIQVLFKMMLLLLLV